MSKAVHIGASAGRATSKRIAKAPFDRPIWMGYAGFGNHFVDIATVKQLQSTASSA